MLAGVNQALAPIMPSVKAVAGSSAGAITAAFIATGISVEDFNRLSQTTNLKGLLGSGFIINKDGKPLYELLQKTIHGNISGFLRRSDIAGLCMQRQLSIAEAQESLQATEMLCLARQSRIERSISVLTKREQANINDEALVAKTRAHKARLEKKRTELVDEIADIRERQKESREEARMLQDIDSGTNEDFRDLMARALDPHGKIYFRDIKIMRALDPSKFKELIVTGVRKDTSKLQIFNSKNTPNNEVALACKASASIPLVFKQVKIGSWEYIDGGYVDNTPTKYFEEAKNPKKKGRTLAMVFGSNKPDNPLHIALYSSKAKIRSFSALFKFCADVLLKFVAWIGGSFKYTEGEERTSQEIRANALGVVGLDPGDVGTLSFDRAQEKARVLGIKGEIATQHHLENMDIVPKTPDLEYRGFFVDVVEKTDLIREKSWASKTDHTKTKTSVLLSFCEKEFWKGKEVDEVVKSFIEQASVSGRTGRMTRDSSAIVALVERLNAAKPPAPKVIIEGFNRVLGRSDSRAKFTSGDFDAVLARQVPAAGSHGAVKAF